MKFPRIQHLPWSVGGTADDIRLADADVFRGKTLVFTEKLDGECTIMNRNCIHARSEDGYGKPWQTWMKSFWVGLRNEIPEGMEICGECLYAVHSIEYSRLTSYFYVFDIILNGKVLSWAEVSEYATLLNLSVVPALRIGRLEKLPIPAKSAFGDVCEGYVVRNVESFNLEDWQDNVAKVVRESHITTDEHWTKNWKKACLISESITTETSPVACDCP